MLGHRRENIEEDRRPDSQHVMITQAIMDGRVIHDSIPTSEVKDAIADICCGTGIWLKDVSEPARWERTSNN